MILGVNSSVYLHALTVVSSIFVRYIGIALPLFLFCPDIKLTDTNHKKKKL